MRDPAPSVDVFVSYNHSDQQLATRLRDALTGRGFTVWLDSNAIAAGDRWGRSIEGALESAKTFVVVATENAMKSRWVETEYLAALVVANRPGSELRLVALLFETVKLPLILSTFQSVDFRGVGQFAAGVEDLSKGIAAGRTQEETQPTRANPQASPAAGAEDSQTEVVYLRKAIGRERQSIQQIRVVRTVAPVLGLLVPAMVTAFGFAPLGVATLTLALAMSTTMGLVGWAATLPRLTDAQDRIDKLDLLQGGLTDCEHHPQPKCDQFRIEFWRTFRGGPAIQ
jgi:hypothetical protein